MRYLILLSPSTNWIDDLALHNQPFMPEHALYVQNEYNKGTVILAGPFGESTGGAIIIDSAEEDYVVQFAENDPTIKNGIFNYKINQWDYKMSKFENEIPDFDQRYVDSKHKIQRELGII